MALEKLLWYYNNGAALMQKNWPCQMDTGHSCKQDSENF
jgi:hypothetical protein